MGKSTMGSSGALRYSGKPRSKALKPGFKGGFFPNIKLLGEKKPFPPWGKGRKKLGGGNIWGGF